MENPFTRSSNIYNNLLSKKQKQYSMNIRVWAFKVWPKGYSIWKVGGGGVWCAFKKMPRGGLRIGPKALRGGLTGCFLHCVNGKKITAGYPRKKWKIAAGWSENLTPDTPPPNFSNGIALTHLKLFSMLTLLGWCFVIAASGSNFIFLSEEYWRSVDGAIYKGRKQLFYQSVVKY